MVIFVPSHAGLALLLMVTLYPILIRSGVSPMSALGVIGCAQFVDVGPGSGNAILAAQTAGLMFQNTSSTTSCPSLSVWSLS